MTLTRARRAGISQEPNGLWVPGVGLPLGALAPSAVEAVTNLLDDDTAQFTTSIGVWDVTVGTLTRDAGSGDPYGVTAASTTAYVTNDDRIPVTEGSEYAFSADVRGSTSGGRFYLRVTWLDETITTIGATVTVASNLSVPAGVWTRVGGTATAPAGAVFADLLFLTQLRAQDVDKFRFYQGSETTWSG